MKQILVLVLFLIIGCVSSSLYNSNYEVIHGKLISVPITDRATKRVTIYMACEEEGMNIIAIAENKENFNLLRHVATEMGNSKAAVFLFVKPAGSEWHEYVDSVDYEVFGIGYYDYHIQRYVTVITTYGNSFADVMRSQDWAAFTTSLVKKGIGMAL